MVTHSEGGSLGLQVVFKAEWTAYCSHCHLQSLNDFRGPKNGERSVPDNGIVSAPAILYLEELPKYNQSGKTHKAQFPIFFMIP